MYSFLLVMPIDEVTTTLEVVYPSHEASNEHLEHGLKQLAESYNRRSPPSRLIVICPSGIEQRIRDIYVANAQVFNPRLISTSHVTVAPFDQCGQFISDGLVHLKATDTHWHIDDNFLVRLANSGIEQIFDNNKTILHAPHGYVFRKPSGREEDIFVRAGNMLRTPDCLAVFNHLLLRRLPRGCSQLFIDSFTILSFAIGLQSIVSYFRHIHPCLPALAIHNTHSYEISSEFRIPNQANYLVLISASTSGKYARKLVEENQAELDRIIHLVGVGSANSDFRKSCIYFRERERPRYTTGTGNRQSGIIEIDTEEFLIAQGPPRPVRISHRHVNRKVADEFQQHYYKKALLFHEPGPHLSYAPFTISGENAKSPSSPIGEWVRRQLVHQLPASARTILHMNDNSSQLVAKWINKAIGGRRKVISLNELRADGLDPGGHDGSFVVIAHQDPRFDALGEAAIALRQAGQAHRHYVLCYAFPSSRANYDRLKADLRLQTRGGQYGWSEFLVLPVGSPNLHEALAAHRNLYTDEAVEPHRAALGDNLTEALTTLRAARRIGCDELFLPRVNGDPLKLRHGSVFFDGLNPSCLTQITVYAMVSAALQKAREPALSPRQTSLPSELRFDDNPFVRSILDPSMFARFSDGILRSSLLRAARQSELDYSASDSLSRQFMTICESVLDNHENPAGDAALEFVYALATNKVLLRRADHLILCEKIASVEVLDALYSIVQDPEKRIL